MECLTARATTRARKVAVGGGEMECLTALATTRDRKVAAGGGRWSV